MKTRLCVLGTWCLAFMGAAGGVLGCGDELSADGGQREDVERTRLSGAVYFDHFVADEPVRIYGFVDHKKGELFAETVTDADGLWSAELGFLEGPFLVEAEVSQGHVLSRIVVSASLGVETKDVLVTPITTLAAGYMCWFLETRDAAIGVAAERVESLLYGHFGGLDHGRILPSDPSVDLDAEGQDQGASGLLSDGALSGLLIAGLQHEAETAALAQGLSPEGAVNLLSFVEALVEDVRQDGVFDGRGVAELKLGTWELSGDTLRADYARGLLGFLSSEANSTRYKKEDLEVLAGAIATRSSDIFPSTRPAPLDQTGPSVSIRVFGPDGVGSDGVVGVDVHVEVIASDPSGVAELKVYVPGVSEEVLGPDQDEAVERFFSGLRTDLLGVGANVIDVTATDRLGQVTYQSLQFFVEENGPDLSVQLLNASGRPSTVFGDEALVDVSAIDSSGIRALRVAVIGADVGVIEPDTDESAPRVYAKISTSKLDEGEHQLEIVATDMLGNDSRRVISFLVDHTAPSISVESGVWTQSLEMPFSVSMSDAPDFGVVKTLELYDRDVRTVWADPDAEISGVFPLTEGVRKLFVFVATDEAGNSSRKEVVVVSDRQAPEIHVEPTSFVDEASLSAVLSADGRSVEYRQVGSARSVELGETGWPVRFSKYFTRMDVSESLNTPVLTLSVSDALSDVGPQGLAYRYLVAGAEKREWTSVTRDEDGRFRIPIGYQTLGPWLARVGPSESNRIEVRAVDGPGNVATRTFDFFVQVLAPPAWFGHCDASPAVSGLSLANRNMGMFFNSASKKVAQGFFRYPDALPVGSMAPDPELLLAAQASGPMTSRITRISFRKILAQREGFQSTPRDCGPVSHSLGNTNYVSGSCESGLYPDEGVHWSASGGQGDPLAVVNTHAVAAKMMTGGTEVSLSTAALVPNGAVEVGLFASPSYLDAAGRSYLWPETTSVPDGYQSWSERRYFVPGTHATGLDVLRMHSNGRNVITRAFSTLLYVDGFTLSVAPPVLEASFRAMPHVDVPIIVDASCMSVRTFNLSL